MRRIYARLGRQVTSEFTARMQAWLADPENAVDRHGRYLYSYEAFALERDWVDALFADYSHYFGLNLEENAQ